jgi:cell wall-associated NlpC family hydrolase
MILKKINLLKFATLICFPVIVLFIIAHGLLREVNRVPERNATLIRDALIKPVKVNVSLRDSIVSFGMSLLGTPYVEGACSKDGFDCSGFVYFVFQHFKIQIPRSSSQFKNFGREIPIDSVRKGDILVFLSPTRNVIGHVGIVSNPKGKESDFIHASSGSNMNVTITSLKQERYIRRLVKALDVL